MNGEHNHGLRAAGAARSAAAAERSRRALVDLHRRGETITFAGIAARANVSRQFLYTHADLRAEIERLRNEPTPAPARLRSREHASDESIRTRLRAALDENKRLREEIAALRDELALTHGHVRELELAKRGITRARAAAPRHPPPTDAGTSSMTCQPRQTRDTKRNKPDRST